MSVVFDLESTFGLGLVPKRHLTLVRGTGTEVYDETGEAFIDCVAGHGVASLGHAHPKLVAAIRKQAENLMTCSASFANNTRAELLELLAKVTPPGLGRSFLCNSGAEAVEAAIKFTRLATRRSEIVCARRAFHGRTMGALSATFHPRFRKGVEPLVPGFRFVPFNNCNALAATVTTETAAVLLEPIQGEGGVHPASEEYLQTARDICNQTGAMLILDEVQTGFCRTGRWFACEHFGVIPDVLCVAKGMAGGFPIGATICPTDLELPSGVHGSTFGGNPLACAAAVATIRQMEEIDLPQLVKRRSAEFLKRMFNLKSPIIREIRGMGYLIGIDLREPARPYLDRLLDKRVLALQAGKTVLRLLPPLTISLDELATVASALENVLPSRLSS